jgi:hypothetical protein
MQGPVLTMAMDTAIEFRLNAPIHVDGGGGEHGSSYFEKHSGNFRLKKDNFHFLKNHML